MTEKVPGPRYSPEEIRELDELVYRRFRSQHSASESFSSSDATRISQIVSHIWKLPRIGLGDVVAGVRLEEIVGKGAFGTVWRGQELRTGEPRAVKVFDVDRLKDGLAVHLFRRGVRAMLFLRDQNAEERSQNRFSKELSQYIVQIREVEAHMLAFSMDWVKGGDLTQGALRGRSVSEKVRVFKHIVEAVSYAHTRPKPVIHRDIKPHNIVMDGDTPVITDFDLADMAFDKTLSRHAAGGTLVYAAPEQLSGESEQAEPRSDIYSLGRLFHFMLLEREPAAIVASNPALDDLDEYPEGLVKIIRRCCLRDVEKRYNSAKELLGELARYKEVDSVGVAGPSLSMAWKHWKQAETMFVLRRWEKAFWHAEQALAYATEADSPLAEEWSFRILAWRVRKGEWSFLPVIIATWLRRLPTPTLFLLIVLLVSPVGFPLSSLVASRARQDKLELALQRLFRAASLQEKQARVDLAMFRESPNRLAFVRRRLAQLLLQKKIKHSCRYMRLSYLLAPRSRDFFQSALTGHTAIHKVYVNHILKQAKGIRWGRIHCTERVVWPWMVLAPTPLLPPRMVRFVLHLPQSDLRFLDARHVMLDRSDMSGADLRMSLLHRVALRGTRLQKTDFSGADLRGVLFDRAKASWARFSFADLRGAILDRTIASFADFRHARLEGADFRWGTFRGAIFHADSLPALRRGGLFHRSFRDAICLSRGEFALKGRVDACYQWHSSQRKRASAVLLPRPAHCPAVLSVHSIFVSFPPGSLRQEGVCPWHREVHDRRQRPVSRPVSRPVR